MLAFVIIGIIGLIILVACFFAYRYGEIHELHRVRAEFDKTITACKKIKNSPDLSGLLLAENIVDDLLREEEQWL